MTKLERLQESYKLLSAAHLKVHEIIKLAEWTNETQIQNLIDMRSHLTDMGHTVIEEMLIEHTKEYERNLQVRS